MASPRPWADVDLEHLEVLRELAVRGSVTAVAEAVHKTPSAVSQQLKILQRQTGVVLVQRVGRGVRLTDAGRALANTAIEVATALAKAEAGWQSYRGDVGGVVRLASFYSAGELLVPGLLERMAHYPSITVETYDEDVSQDDFAALTADYDVVVAHRSDDLAERHQPEVQVELLMREPLDVALPLNHPLAGRNRVRPADVIGEDWIAPPPGFPIDRVLTALAANAGSPVRVVRRTTHLPLIEKLVARGHGIALLPRHTSKERAEGRFVLVPLTDLRAGRLLEALVRPDRAERRAVRVVLDQLLAESRLQASDAPQPSVPEALGTSEGDS